MAVHEADLERLLREVATRIEWPPEPQFAPRVRARLEVETAVAPSWWERARSRLAQPSFAVTIAIVAVSTVLIVSESARTAVADFLGLDGVRVEFVEELPEGIGTTLSLGERVTLEDARNRVGFDVLVPTDEDLGAPDRVFFDSAIGEGQVSLVYAPREGLASTANENVGMLVMQYEVSLDEQYYKKLVDTSNVVEGVMVGSDFGFWVDGPHTIEYREDGIVGQDPPRLAGNTLLWQHDDVTIRLESALSKTEALRIAESMR